MDLPRELLNTIISCIDGPSDLLELAVASKTFYDIVVPDHLHYRLIRCDSDRLDVWRALIQHPHLARRIRYLEVVDQSRVFSTTGLKDAGIIPSSLHQNAYKCDKIDDETIRAELVAATGLMKNLKRFEWTAATWPPKKLFDTLCLTCPAIPEVKMHLPATYVPSEEEFMGLTHCPVWNLRGLTHFSFSDQEFDRRTSAEYMPVIQSLAQTIASQPHLQDLRIYLDGVEGHNELNEVLRQTFKNTHWPSLKHLDIPASFLLGAEAEFFEAHPAIESLSLGSWPPLDIDYANMQLRTLEVTWNPMLRDCKAPQRLIPTLEHLNIMLDEEDLQLVDPMPDNFLLKHVVGIKSLILTIWNYYGNEMLKNLLCYPMDIERLALLNGDPPFDEVTIHSQHEIIGILRGMPNLTHFYYVDLESWSFAGLVEGPGDNDEAIPPLRALTNAIPTLKFVAVLYSRSRALQDLPEWMTLERGPDGSYVGFRPTPYRGHEDIDINRWSSARVKRGL